MNNDIIAVAQLPVIVQQLHEVKVEIEKETDDALKLAVTEETVPAVKKVRTGLNKRFEEFETRRKAVKNAILEPYEAFEKIYKECVTDPITSAVTQLNKRINTVEESLLQNKRLEVKAYFDELTTMHKLEFIEWSDCPVKVTKSASMKSLKENVLDFVNGILDNIKLIGSSDYRDEVMYLFKKRDSGFFLSATEALCFVTEKNKAVTAAPTTAEPEAPASREPEDEPLSPPIRVEGADAKLMRVTVTVTGTIEDLKKLKKFLTEGAYKVEYR